MLGMGFEPMSSARKAKMIGRTTPTERGISRDGVALHKPHQSPTGCGSVTHASDRSPLLRAPRPGLLDDLGERKVRFHVGDLHLDCLTGRCLRNKDGVPVDLGDAITFLADINDLDLACVADADRGG